LAIAYGDAWLDIANRALGRINKGRLESLSEEGELAQYVNTFIGEAIETIMSARSWSVAKRAELVRKEITPVYGYVYSYALPGDLINIVSIETGGADYRPEGSSVLTDAEEVSILYTFRTEDPSDLPGYLKRAISTQLAFLLSSALTSSEQLAARIAQESQLALEEAIRADSRRYKQALPDTWYDEAR